jgi:hypothetical protein
MTSWATSASRRSWLKANARRRMSASVTVMPAWTEPCLPRCVPRSGSRRRPPAPWPLPRGCSGLGFQHPASSHIGHHQRIGVLVVAQRTSPLLVEVERPQTHRAYPQREPEHCPHARVQRWRGEGEPPASHRIRQVRLGYDPVLLVGIQARPLAQRVLQVFDDLAHVVGGTQRPAWHVTGHEHDTSTSHPRDLREHGAQPGCRQPVSSSPQLGQDPTKPVAWHLGTPAPARVRPAADSAETTHLLAPSPRKEASARTGLNASHSPDTGPLVANITPQPYRAQLAPACGRPADCDTGSSPGGQSTRRCDQREYEVPGG